MISLTSETLKNYYGEIPLEYDLKFIHYNVEVINESYEEYKNIEDDLKKIYDYAKNDFMIYFSNLKNYEKIYKNTNIIQNYNNSIYIRIRNNNEYNLYKKLEENINIIVELDDLKNIELHNEKLIVQIDKISELTIESLNNLLKKYNIIKIMVGQMAYITDEYSFLLDELSEMFNMDKSNQLELEKNNKITNDMYDVDTYKNIIDNIENLIKINGDKSNVKTFINVFNYIAENVYYADDGVSKTLAENQNLIGPLLNKKSVCEGYSKLLQQVCSLLNIESIIVSGGRTKENGGHVWNQVCIDGIWYNSDVTGQSYAKHNNEDWNLCLVSDDCLRYKATSPFRHICSKNYTIN